MKFIILMVLFLGPLFSSGEGGESPEYRLRTGGQVSDYYLAEKKRTEDEARARAKRIQIRSAQKEKERRQRAEAQKQISDYLPVAPPPNPPVQSLPSLSAGIQGSVGSGGVKYVAAFPTQITSAGVEARGFPGGGEFLYEANPSSMGSGGSGCELDKETKAMVCRGGCWSKTYRQINPKTGRPIALPPVAPGSFVGGRGGTDFAVEGGAVR